MIRLIDNNQNSKENIESFVKTLFEGGKVNFTTSGTTGTPKSITHSVDVVTKYVKQLNENDVWGLTYDYTKIAGSQVIAQAYKNNNLLVNLYQKTTNEIHSLITKYNITHLSGTPTFYRLNFVNEIFPSVKQVTLGGEVVTENILILLKKVFPEANISNIYALTEFGSILSSTSHLFSLSKRTSKNVKIKNNTIHIYFNNKWHDTKDVIEWVDEFRFKIIGRDTNMINVGGVKVNPIKVETYLNQIEAIKNSFVYSETNSVIGNIVVADIVLSHNITKPDIKQYLKTYLNPYEIPLKFNIVTSIKTNSTGKIIRQ